MEDKYLESPVLENKKTIPSQYHQVSRHQDIKYISHKSINHPQAFSSSKQSSNTTHHHITKSTQTIKMANAFQIAPVRASSISSDSQRPTAQGSSNNGSSYTLKNLGKKVMKGLKEHHEKTEAAFDTLYGRRTAVQRS